MKTFRTATAAAGAALLALALVAPAQATTPDDEAWGEPGAGSAHRSDRATPALLTLQERDCFEHNTFRNTTHAAVAERLPAGWLPSTRRVRPNGSVVTTTLFTDYTCRAFSSAGSAPREQTTTYLVAPAVHEATGERRLWVLEHGSGDAELVGQLRALGTSSQLLTATSTLTPLPDGRVAYTQSYVDDDPTGADLDHERTGTAPVPAHEVRNGAVQYWFSTPRGPLSMTFHNRLDASVTPAITETFSASSSFRSVYGMANASGSVPGAMLFTTGSWTTVVARDLS